MTNDFYVTIRFKVRTDKPLLFDTLTEVQHHVEQAVVSGILNHGEIAMQTMAVQLVV